MKKQFVKTCLHSPHIKARLHLSPQTMIDRDANVLNLLLKRCQPRGFIKYLSLDNNMLLNIVFRMHLKSPPYLALLHIELRNFFNRQRVRVTQCQWQQQLHVMDMFAATENKRHVHTFTSTIVSNAFRREGNYSFVFSSFNDALFAT